jgi:DNA repair protein RadC
MYDQLPSRRTSLVPRLRRAFGLRLVREPLLTKQLTPAKTALRSPLDVFTFMAPFAAQESSESFWALPLDTQHQCVAPITITRGIVNASLVHPREVFRAMIAANATSVILAHNHPSGDPTPSKDDRVVTQQLVSAGRLLDIPVHDHVILGDGRYVSFAEAGLL